MAKEPSYESIDHTADTGIHVFGHNPRDLFQNAAMALMDQLVEPAGLCPGQEKRLTIEGADWPDLMVNWLREILYLWVGKDVLVQSVQIEFISKKRLTAHLRVDPFSQKRHQIKSEIKAVTYHQIQVVDTGNRWEAKVIFDT